MTAPKIRIFLSNLDSRYSYVDVSFRSWKTGRKTYIIARPINRTPPKTNMYWMP